MIMIHLLVGCQLEIIQLCFFDNQVQSESGIYYENLGPIKIITNTWDLAIFLNTSCYTQQWNIIEDRLGKIKQMGKEIEKY